MNKLLVLLALSPIWIWTNIQWQLRQDLPIDLEGRDLLLIGQIVQLPEVFNNTGMRFVFDVTTAQFNNVLTNFTGRVKLNWFKDAPQLQAGEHWELTARLKARHGHFNPGGFDIETTLFRNGINATGYVRKPHTAHRIAIESGNILSWRAALRKRLWQELPRNFGSGTIMAVTLGDISGLDSQHWEVLKRCGISHLISISGSHLTIIGILGFALIKKLWRCNATLCLRLADTHAAAIGSLLLVLSYAMVAGFPVPTLRALIMFGFLHSAILLRRIVCNIDSLIVALLSILLFDPLAILSPSFWLSFGTIAALIYGMSNRLRPSGILWMYFRAQWVVFIWLIPLLALLFKQISIIAPLINLIAIPLFGVLLPILLIAMIIAIFGNLFWPVQVLAWLLNQTFVVFEYFASWPWANITLPQLPWWVWIFAFPGAALVTAPRGWPGRWVGVVLMLPVLWWRPPLLESGAVRFNLLDVGQGLAAVVQTRNHCLVYDAGPAFSSFDSGESIVFPALTAFGIGHIDTVIVSHADNDHAGGLAGLLAHIQVSEVLSGEPAALAVPGARQCETGQNWVWDGVKFSILYPRSPWPKKSNNRSCVLRIESKNHALLITGDLHQMAEKSLISIFNEQISSQILVAGHHGSNTSTSKELLEAVKPQWVFVAAGYRNRFSFPRPQMLQRVAKVGAKIVNTANDGALEMWLDADGEMRGPISFRKINGYPWTHQPHYQN